MAAFESFFERYLRAVEWVGAQLRMDSLDGISLRIAAFVMTRVVWTILMGVFSSSDIVHIFDRSRLLLSPGKLSESAVLCCGFIAESLDVSQTEPVSAAEFVMALAYTSLATASWVASLIIALLQCRLHDVWCRRRLRDQMRWPSVLCHVKKYFVPCAVSETLTLP